MSEINALIHQIDKLRKEFNLLKVRIERFEQQDKHMYLNDKRPEIDEAMRKLRYPSDCSDDSEGGLLAIGEEAVNKLNEFISEIGREELIKILKGQKEQGNEKK